MALRQAKGELTIWDISDESDGEKEERRTEFKRLLAKTLRLIDYIIKNSDENLTIQDVIKKLYSTADQRAADVTRYTFNLIAENMVC